MIVIRDFIGEICQLRLQSRLLPVDEALAQFTQSNGVVVRAMLEDSLAAFEGQVEPVEFCIVFFEFIDDAKRLKIVFESAEAPHAFVQRILAGVPERRVTQVVGQTNRLG